MATAEGKITQIIGAVVDVAFPRDSIPKVYDALKLKDVDLTLEVQQQLGDGVVRTIAMGASEGLKRGLAEDLCRMAGRHRHDLGQVRVPAAEPAPAPQIRTSREAREVASGCPFRRGSSGRRR